MAKQIKKTKVDGITVLQLFIDGKFKTEVELSTQFTAKAARQYLINY